MWFEIFRTILISDHLYSNKTHLKYFKNTDDGHFKEIKKTPKLVIEQIIVLLYFLVEEQFFSSRHPSLYTFSSR